MLNDRLQKIQEGGQPETRKELIKSMEELSKDGFSKMELRSSEVTESDLKYFQKQGLKVMFIDGRDYSYYILDWSNEDKYGLEAPEPPKIECITTFNTIAKGILKIASGFVIATILLAFGFIKFGLRVFKK